MRRIYFIILLEMLVAMTATAKRHKQIVILHTNDTHSTIMPLKAELADTSLAGRGGCMRRMAMIEAERQKCPELLLIDSGDFSQGSSYYTMFKGEVEVELMNLMGYDATTIGNHEFDFGLDNMARLFRLAKFPVVCSNYDFTGTVLDGLVKPYVTLKRAGVKIGLFALCPKLQGLVASKNYGDIKFLDPTEVAQQMADLLRGQEKCDLVVCISHLGWEDSVYPDNTVISQTNGIDLVLGGHTHTYMKQLKYVENKDGRPIGVDQNGKHGVFVGKLVLDLQKK